jgi:hypothetical protein
VKETNTKVRLMVITVARKRGIDEEEEQQKKEMIPVRLKRTPPTFVSKQN